MRKRPGESFMPGLAEKQIAMSYGWPFHRSVRSSVAAGETVRFWKADPCPGEAMDRGIRHTA